MLSKAQLDVAVLLAIAESDRIMSDFIQSFAEVEDDGIFEIPSSQSQGEIADEQIAAQLQQLIRGG